MNEQVGTLLFKVGKPCYFRILFIGCYLWIFTSCLYCVIAFHFHHFNVYVENFQSYVSLYLYVCWCLVVSVRPK